ncbi:adenylate/guanylate cyclase domain-containing protein [Enhydrobacter sp.]|jgi:class 3 adenylate cyclase|uniref:adenylate/guanylate cyclase domain-containing protein n=1 Tax=Enhydrobacter sp. TaxID=1894999 RepID=UPI00261B8290|nr:adenylate/guanylate cyclase domain-containing protein [Enhydrobacter sp.]WIM12233.1 MAG: Adenylate cyclase [Enhydrobacter sp.]
MSDAQPLFAVLRQSADADCVAALERLVREAPDRLLARVNALDLARRENLDEEKTVATLLHAARIGLFEMSWNVLCPSCSGVLDTNATLKSVRSEEYYCAFCAVSNEPTLDEMVEVSFTVSPRVRRLGAHNPDELPIWEYYRQVFWGTGVDLPGDSLEAAMQQVTLDAVELPAGDKAILSLQLPAETIIVLEPVTHAAQFIDVKGEPTSNRQSLTLVYTNLHAPTGTTALRPGPVRLSLENRAASRVLPAIWVANDAMHRAIGKRRPFLTAKRLLSNQTFRDIYRTDTLGIDQRLKITSLTFLFTDLKGSTELYERVGDLVAFDLVREHFRTLNDIVAAEGGAVVKTIGDAVMATFLTPDHALAAALRMREAMRKLNAAHGRDDLLLKIGIHEGPCLAVTLNERQDYFGQTVNIASRVQGLALSPSILATDSVVSNPQSASLLKEGGLTPAVHRHALRGIASEMAVYEIP